MISTAIRTAVPRNWGAHHGCRAATATAGCGRSEAVKRYSKRRMMAEEAARGAAEAQEEEEEEEEEKEEDEKAEAAGRPPARVCVDCGTSETPLWRSGPEGPKSLCNACGIKYRKRRRALGASRGSKLGASPTKGEDGEQMSTEELKRRQREKQERMLKLLVLQHQQKMRSRMEEKAAAEAGKEVEEAALLLMSLSSGLFVHS